MAGNATSMIDRSLRPQLIRCLAAGAVAGLLLVCLKFDWTDTLLSFISGHGPSLLPDTLPDYSHFIPVLTVLFALCVLFIFGRLELAVAATLPVILSSWAAVRLTEISSVATGARLPLVSLVVFVTGMVYGFLALYHSAIANKYGSWRLPFLYYPLFLLVFTAIIIAVAVIIKVSEISGPEEAYAAAWMFAWMSLSFKLIMLLFDFLVKDRGRPRVEPVTFTSLFVSVSAFLLFLTGSALLSGIIPLLLLFPAWRRKSRYFFHVLVSATLRIIVYSIFPIKKIIEVRNKVDFSKPGLIVCNHQSHLDLAVILMLCPKIIVLTNRWVWNNPFYGLVVRYADFYPLFRGIDLQLADRLGKRVREGYSVLVFPEGTRTGDGKIHRFHQGAFWLADKLGVDIQPLLLHGANHCMIKHEFFLRPGVITLRALEKQKVLPPGDGETYRPQAQALCAIYRREFEKMSRELETPEYFRQGILNQYIYKGPILEWYARIKVSLEKNYTSLNDLIPRKAEIVDIGCGYGFLCHFLGKVSPERNILGMDFDGAKTAVAGQIRPGGNIRFMQADILDVELPTADVFLLMDVLHYLPSGYHETVIEKCMRKLNPDGMIIIRDADADRASGIWRTRFNEFNSTRFFKFNKTGYDSLSYTSGSKLEIVARKHNFAVEKKKELSRGSDAVFILKPCKT